MLIDYIRQVHASQKFKIKDEFEFLDFDDITPETLSEEASTPDHIEIWAAVKIKYEGEETPDSYKILNLTIGDWVASHEAALTKVIHEKLRGHFEKSYPNSDASGIDDEAESAIWLDQLDYMPRINEEEKTIIIEIDLVIESEVLED